MKRPLIGATIALTILTLTPISVVQAEPSGAYLAARQARYDYDFEAAAKYFSQALIADPQNPAVLEQALVSFVSLGNVERAIPVAQKMLNTDLESQISNMVIVADLARNEAYEELIKTVEAGNGLGPLGDGMIKAWAEVGMGNMTSALATFDTVSKQPGLRDFALYHKALALANVGDFNATSEIFSGESAGAVQYTRRGIIAWAQALSQLERQQEARELIDENFTAIAGGDIDALREQLVSDDPVAFSVVRSARDGLAEVFYSLGQALADGAGDDYVLLFSRLAEYISPANVDATLMSAEILNSLERYDLAARAYENVPADSPSYMLAELGRAQALNDADNVESAINVLQKLAEAYPENPMIFMSGGDLYREHERFAEAIPQYDRAIALFEEIIAEDENKNPETDRAMTVPWFALYSRAVSLERTGQWEKAEADFRRALKINPDQPQVLNYLGYSMVEKRVNLDEALALIERAVKLEPDSGYIVDSLGWVQYRLGKYEDAARNLERAAELMPVDAVVNDHLGDALWMVGRKTEAEFQWKRALSFIDPNKPSPDIDPERIRRKLSEGLDKVLAAEKTTQEVKVDHDG